MPFSSKGARATLWVLQALLAAVFLFAAGFKLAMPLAALAKASPHPPLFPIVLPMVVGTLAAILAWGRSSQRRSLTSNPGR